MILSLLFVICLIVYFTTRFKGISDDETYEYLKKTKGEEYARNQIAYKIAKEQIKKEDKEKWKWQGLTHWTWQHIIKKRAKEIASADNFEEIYVYNTEPKDDILEKTKSETTVTITMNDNSVDYYNISEFQVNQLAEKLANGEPFIKVGSDIISTSEIKIINIGTDN